MLASLSIRDIVLIEQLELPLGPGMTVLTGETGAGKSILLDALGLALGGRGDSGLVRVGADQGVVTARVELRPDHPLLDHLRDNGIAVEDGELLLRRVQLADGRSRAYLNDQPVSVTLLREVGARVAEIHGQHDDRAFLDRETHGRLLDAYGGLEGEATTVARLWQELARAEEELDSHRKRVAALADERDFLTHAVKELTVLGPQVGEEVELSERRQLMMNSEKFADELKETDRALMADGALDATLNAALRRLERKREGAGGALDDVCAAVERVVVELTEAKDAVARARQSIEFDPKELERSEERLFALRAAARKYQTSVDGLAERLATMSQELEMIDSDQGRTKALEQARGAAQEAYIARAQNLSERRHKAGGQLDSEVMAELPPLKLDRARFVTSLETVAPEQAGPRGLDRVEFTVATNPGTPPGILMKVASGGELARFILALKVALAARGSAPTLIFDEVDTAVGGAVADAIGARLARLASSLQVLAVTHSPQVAAQAGGHILISKASDGSGTDERAITCAVGLDEAARHEEVARMLSGQDVTDEARAAARRLMKETG
jgi:DNA repair protein RecN (Recombination protein N)